MNPSYRDDVTITNRQNDSYDDLTIKEIIQIRLSNFFYSSREMLLSSISHLRRPSTIIIILLLIATYVLLGVAGTVGFSFYSKNIVQYVTTNLDIIVNALLGYFFGPLTCAISVTLCTITRMIIMGNNFFIGNIIGACLAGFLHGWILYRFRPFWFRTRFKSFYTDTLAKVIATRFFVSSFVNILVMSVMHKLINGYPIRIFIALYSKSGVPLLSMGEFFKVFFLGIAFESIMVFFAIVIANYFSFRAFPTQLVQPGIFVDKNGVIINPEDDLIFNDNNF